MSNSLVWVDIPVTDLDRAISFYTEVLGKKVSKVGGPGFKFGLFAHTSGKDVGGSLVVDPENQPSLNGPLIYLNSNGRLQDAIDKATANGGKLLRPIQDMGPHGMRAVIIDSEGNRVALHSMDK